MSALLQLEGVTMEFGGLRAVGDLDFHIAPEEMVGLIGPNGAGKTTVFNIITGVYKPTHGAIHFNGVSLHDKKANRITALGIARTEPRVLLDPLSVHTVLHLVEGLRAAGQTRGLLDEVYRRLSDTSLIESKDLQESLGQMKQGQGEVVRARPSA